MALAILSAGAAQGVVTALAQQRGTELQGEFGAVGAIQERLDAGAAGEIVILTRGQMEALRAQGRVARIADLGRVRTGVAVRARDPRPAVADADALRVALLAADEIYHPDPVKATAGIHFASVLAQLGIAAAVAARLRPHANGATAMRALAASAAGAAIGCTQITEIRNTPGVVLVGALPAAFELATVYTAGLRAERAEASEFFTALTGPASVELRRQKGFEL